METSKMLEWPGKSGSEGGDEHPAVFHMLDVAAVAELLVDPHELESSLRDALILLVAFHDLGKISETFRDMIRAGVRQPHPHWQITEIYLSTLDPILAPRLGAGPTQRSLLYAATAGHHGRPPDLDERAERRARRSLREGLQQVPEIAIAFSELWPDASLEGLSWDDVVQLSWWLPGLVSAADWIGSNATWFPADSRNLSPAEYLVVARERAREAVILSGYGRAGPSEDSLFDFELRPMQDAAASIPLPDGPVLAVIEDETGAGKTEAAMILAQRMLLAGKGRGMFMALPTMATSDAMFRRARDTVGRMFGTRPSLTLAHGHAGLSEDYADLRGASTMRTDDVTCTDWLADDRRRALLADVGVGTVDQSLLAALPTRFNTLRYFGLSSKILIVDEVHEIGDPYMSRLLQELLRMHRVAGGSAILLTATLPIAERRQLMETYGTAPEGVEYPCLSLSSGERRVPDTMPAPKGDVEVRRIGRGDAAGLLAHAVRSGAACVWIRNAVDEAIDAVRELRAIGVEAELLHARFTLEDRKKIETLQIARFGKEGTDRAGRVLVATQVVESSLDLDFDMMVSDLAPMASLIQRAGRLWRHMDLRPKEARPTEGPVLHVVAPDPSLVRDQNWLVPELGSGGYVYDLATMWQTAHHLFAAGWISAPEQSRYLIEAAHGDGQATLPRALDRSALEAYGKSLSQRGLANQNVIRYEEGYRNGGAAADDRTYPTRLGVEQLVLVLARRDGDRLVPWSEAGWMASEVSASRVRLERLPLPDQSAAEMASIISTWPAWKRHQCRLCVPDEGGLICEGLKYSPEIGLVFISPGASRGWPVRTCG